MLARRGIVRALRPWGAVSAWSGRWASSAAAAGPATGSTEEELPVLRAAVRRGEELGSRASRRMRNEGRWVPGQIMGNAEPTYNVKVEAKELLKELRRQQQVFLNKVYDVELDMGNGETRLERVVAHEVKMEPLPPRRPYDVSWVRFNPQRTYQVAVRFVNEDECVILKRGGYMLTLRPTVRVKTFTHQLPDYIDFDLTNADAGEVITVKKRAIVPEGVEVVSPRSSNEHVVAVIQGTRRGGSDAEELGE